MNTQCICGKINNPNACKKKQKKNFLKALAILDTRRLRECFCSPVYEGTVYKFTSYITDTSQDTLTVLF